MRGQHVSQPREHVTRQWTKYLTFVVLGLLLLCAVKLFTLNDK